MKILKKEKKRADDAAVQIASIIHSQSLSYQRVSITSTMSQLKEENVDSVPTNHRGRVTTVAPFRDDDMDIHNSNHEGHMFMMAQVRERNMENHPAEHGERMSTKAEMKEGNVVACPLDHGGRTSTTPQMRERHVETQPMNHGAVQHMKKGISTFFIFLCRKAIYGRLTVCWCAVRYTRNFPVRVRHFQ